MTTQPKPTPHQTLLCCGQSVEVYNKIQYKEGEGTGLKCSACGNITAGKDLKEAESLFIPNPPPEKMSPKQTKPQGDRMNNQNNQNLPATRKLDEANLMALASPVIGNDEGAVKRLLSNNVRYVEKLPDKSWGKIWRENPQSIIHATEEAMIMGAELGKMGDLVPYGSTCEFIPSIEAYEFALTNGNNAPFDNIEIEAIHENDDVTTGRKDGSFFIDLSMGIPRGKIIAVACYGTLNKDGRVIGEVYDAERLLEKAREHSSSYQYYLNDVASFEAMKAEGKTQVMNGRHYFEKQMSGPNGAWTKKIFLDELSNPYAGADQVEMLKKTAGKSFCRKFARVRNAEAARDEIKTHKQAMDKTFSETMEVVGEVEEA